jgi:hypothetical protein
MLQLREERDLLLLLFDETGGLMIEKICCEAAESLGGRAMASLEPLT